MHRHARGRTWHTHACLAPSHSHSPSHVFSHHPPTIGHLGQFAHTQSHTLRTLTATQSLSLTHTQKQSPTTACTHITIPSHTLIYTVTNPHSRAHRHARPHIARPPQSLMLVYTLSHMRIHTLTHCHTSLGCQAQPPVPQVWPAQGVFLPPSSIP